MKASRPSGSFLVVSVVALAAVPLVVVGSIVTLAASVVVVPRQIAKAGQHVHLAGVPAPDLEVVGASRSIPQPFEGASAAVRLAD